MATKLKVTLVRSPIGTRDTHRQTVLGLGLKKINQTRELEDTPSVRGMIRKDLMRQSFQGGLKLSPAEKPRSFLVMAIFSCKSRSLSRITIAVISLVIEAIGRGSFTCLE